MNQTKHFRTKLTRKERHIIYSICKQLGHNKASCKKVKSPLLFFLALVSIFMVACFLHALVSIFMIVCFLHALINDYMLDSN